MMNLDEYFREVERLGLGTRDEVLARVFHVDGAARRHAQSIVPSLSDEAGDLVDRLDHAVRVRNPGVHHVCRSTFLGYRREGAAAGAVGGRSQIFLSVVPKRAALHLVFVCPDGAGAHPGVKYVTDRGHHGVGTHQFVARTDHDVDEFVSSFDMLLCPDES